METMLKFNGACADNFICINYLPFVFIGLIKKQKMLQNVLLTLFYSCLISLYISHIEVQTLNLKNIIITSKTSHEIT